MCQLHIINLFMLKFPRFEEETKGRQRRHSIDDEFIQLLEEMLATNGAIIVPADANAATTNAKGKNLDFLTDVDDIDDDDATLFGSTAAPEPVTPSKAAVQVPVSNIQKIPPKAKPADAAAVRSAVKTTSQPDFKFDDKEDEDEDIALKIAKNAPTKPTAKPSLTTTTTAGTTVKSEIAPSTPSAASTKAKPDVVFQDDSDDLDDFLEINTTTVMPDDDDDTIDTRLSEEARRSLLGGSG